MSSSVLEIVDRLEARRKRVRSWVAEDSHPLVIAQVRDAYAALGAMTGILNDMAPALSGLLVDADSREQQMQSLREVQTALDKEKASQLRDEAKTEEDPEQAEFLETLARIYDHSIDIPDMSQVRAAGVLLTASKLYRTADQVSRSRDAEAIKTLGLKTLSTAGKWALKLTPVRQEDLKDLKDAWEALMTIVEPLDDVAATLEAGKMRAIQAEAASSLFRRLQVIRELSEAWSLTALQEPFLAKAIRCDDAAGALSVRLQRSHQEWT